MNKREIILGTVIVLLVIFIIGDSCNRSKKIANIIIERDEALERVNVLNSNQLKLLKDLREHKKKEKDIAKLEEESQKLQKDKAKAKKDLAVTKKKLNLSNKQTAEYVEKTKIYIEVLEKDLKLAIKIKNEERSEKLKWKAKFNLCATNYEGLHKEYLVMKGLVNKTIKIKRNRGLGLGLFFGGGRDINGHWFIGGGGGIVLKLK